MNAENKPTHLIVGATGSIGSNLARRLADEGARLALAGRDADTLHALAQELGASSHVLDGDPFACVELAAQEAVEQHGSLHGVACCAGSLLLKPAHRTSAEELREVLESNLVTAFASVRAGAQALRKNGGSIVLVSSAAARLGLANHEAWCSPPPPATRARAFASTRWRRAWWRASSPRACSTRRPRVRPRSACTPWVAWALPATWRPRSPGCSIRSRAGSRAR